MVEWVKASYSDSQVQDRAFLTTLHYVSTNGKYNIYRMGGSGHHVVVFSDQSKLLRFVNENLGSVFLIRFLHLTDNKYQYATELENGEPIIVTTIARAAVLIPGTKESPRQLSSATPVIVE